MKSLLLVTGIQLFLFGALNAQTNQEGMSKDDNSKEKTPVTWAVKFTPTSLIVGELNFSYEMMIGAHSSLEFTAGPTISNIGIGGIEVRALKNDLVSLDTKIGYFVSAAYRYYPKKDNASMCLMYVSPVLKFRNYRTEMSDDLGNIDDIIANNYQGRLLFNFGVQLWPSRNFLFDIYTGVGLGYRKVEVYSPTSQYDGTAWRHEWQNSSGIEGVHLALDIGVKIGFGK